MQNKPSFLPNLAVHRPVTIVVSLLAIIVVGFIAYKNIPIELLPSGFNPPYLGVWVAYPNANPQEVEEQIARPVEEQVRTISGVSKVETYSSSNGCWTWLEFSPGTNMDVAYDQLRDRMERARAYLPDDFERYYLRRFGRNDAPIIFMSVSFPPEVNDPYYVVEQFIKRPIERIDGVGNIEIWGADEKSIQILIDQDKVKAHRLNMFEVINNLRDDNFAISSGWVYEGDKKFIVRSIGRFKTIEDIQNIPITKFGLKVGDIAEVKYEVRKRTWHQRINGRPGMLLGIFKESLANTVALSHQLEKVLENQILKQPVMKNAEVNFLFVQGNFIEEAIGNLINTGLWGGFFAIVILMFFLRNIRMTIIMMFAIPLSILVSLMVIYFIGWTLNIFVMMGLMISIGMVVDNGIVVLENIYHRRNNGLSPREASIWGASEVNLAIILATLTTIVVFVSMILIEDRSGGLKFYLQRIGLPVVFSLLASLFVALVLIPLATSKLGGYKQAKENKIITRSKAYYNTMLSWVLNHRLDAVIGMLLIIILTGILSNATPQSDQEGGAINDIWLIFDLPNNFSTEDANKFFTSVEDTIYAHAEAYDLKAVDTGFRQGFGRIRMFLHPHPQEQWFTVIYKDITRALGLINDGKMTRDEVLEDIQKRVPKKPGVKFRTAWHGGGRNEEGEVSIMLYGDDTGKLAQLAEEVERRMRLLDGVISVETDREAGTDEIRISMDREVVTRNGLNPNQVAFTLMYAVRGLNLPRYQAKDKEIEMRVQLKEEDRESLGQVKNITFINSQGRAIPLSAVAKFNIDKGFGQIARENGKTFLAVKAKTIADDLPKISAQIDQLMKDFPMPYGYNWQKGSRFEQFNEDMQNFVKALMIAFIFVYLIMAILFESFVLPWSIMFAIPLAFFGAFLALFGTGTPLDIMGIIGMIILVGVVVNNGIVLIDMVNRRRREGYGRLEAILDAGQNRFRPIMMTSFTTIGGLIPMAVGNANLIGMPYAPIGRVLIGGLLTSTFGTLLIVPVFYTLFEDLALFVRRVIGWFRGKGEEGEAALAPEK